MLQFATIHCGDCSAWVGLEWSIAGTSNGSEQDSVEKGQVTARATSCPKRASGICLPGGPQEQAGKFFPV